MKNLYVLLRLVFFICVLLSPAPGAGIVYSIYGVTDTNATGVFSGLAAGPYNLTVTKAGGSVSAAATLVVLAQMEEPVPTLTGLETVCAGTTEVYATQEGMSNYEWILSSGGTITAGGTSTSNTATVLWNTGGVHTISVNYKDGSSGSGVSPAVKNITVNTLPEQPAALNWYLSTVCRGTSVTYTVPQNPSVTYLWSYSGTGATFVTDGSNTNAVTITFSESANSGVLSVSSSNECGAGLPSSMNITVRSMPGPAGPVSGPTYVCPGMKGAVYEVNIIPNAVHYLWKVPEGATIVSGDDTNSIIVDFSETAASGSITVQGSKSCGTGEISPELPITVGPKIPARPKAFIDSATYVKVFEIAMYQVPREPGVNYIWSYTGEGTVIETPYDSGTWLLFSEDATSGTLSVVATNSCEVSEARSIYITVLPKTPSRPAAFIDSATYICAVATARYQVPREPDVNYIWSYTGDGTVIHINYGNDVLLIFTENATSGTLSVVATNSFGVSESRSIFITVSQSQGPAGISRPAAFMDSATYICAAATARYQVPREPGVDYIWSYTGEGTVIDINYDSAVWLIFTENATSGTLSVVATTSCGVSEARSIYITVRQLPGPAGTINGPEYVCQGMKGVVYSVPVIPNATGYRWHVPSGATIVGGANTNSITVDYSVTAASGAITVQGTISCGDGTVSPELIVNVNAVPPTPVIALTDNILCSDAPSGNQWYLNDTLLPGATLECYLAPINGVYSAFVTINGCSSERSNTIDVVLQGDELKDAKIGIFPIPNNGAFTVIVESEEDKVADIMVFNSRGTKVLEMKDVIISGTTNLPFDLSSYPAGTYYLKFISEKGIVTRTIVLTR